MGITSRLSIGFTRGSQTRCPSPSFSSSVSITGLGHFHMFQRWKNLHSRVEGAALG